MRCWYCKQKKTGRFGKQIFNMKIIFPCLIFTVVMTLISCQNTDYSPKPRGFYRIEFPAKSYKEIKTGCPFTFEMPTYSVLSDDHSKQANPCWKNIDFPQFNARLHISYSEITPTSTLEQLTEDARSFAFKHTTKATAIESKRINKKDKKLFGIEYIIQGNTASNYQFYVTDESKNYVRGALYFNEKPNLDSIQPVLNFIKEDIEHIITTFSWK